MTAREDIAVEPAKISSEPAAIAAEIESEASRLGFDAVGFAPASVPDRDAARLREFVALGQHGDMDWMERTLDRRAAPSVLWPEARSVVVLAQNYAPDHDPLETLAATDRANISVYARNRDYHDVVKKRLKQLGRWMASRWGCELKVFVDTAPVLEKTLAARAGIGWQGKHTNLVSRGFGSWLFLGEVFTTLDLAPSTPEGDHCGSCRACLDICPTNAFPRPYALDATRCISYLTIEHRGPIPREFRRAIGNRVYGCDDCLAVCPWNKFAREASEIRLQARADLRFPTLDSFLDLDEVGFRQVFAGSPVKRIGFERFLRNTLISLGNSSQYIDMKNIEKKIRDPSALVRGAAVWALSQHLDRPTFERLRDAELVTETDREVRREWSLAFEDGGT